MIRFYIAVVDTVEPTGICFPPGVRAKGQYETMTEEEFRALSPDQMATELIDALADGKVGPRIERERKAADPSPPSDGALFPDAGPTGPDFYAPTDDDPDSWRNGVDF